MYEEWLAVIRFFHIISSITWIGLLYYFNLVQGQAFGKMEAPARMNAVQHLASRALFYFRWSALATVVFGIVWIGLREAQLQNDFDTSYLDTDAFKSIAVGGGIGIIMMLNVWAIIWPNQKKIIAATTATATQGAAAPPDQPKWARMALLASRANVMLSIPMLFFMVASAHLGSIWD